MVKGRDSIEQLFFKKRCRINEESTNEDGPGNDFALLDYNNIANAWSEMNSRGARDSYHGFKKSICTSFSLLLPTTTARYFAK